MAAWPGIDTSEKFLEKFIPPDYLIDRILQRGYLYTMTGMTGTGKTAVCLRLAAHVALGLSIGEAAVKKGHVLYLAGENHTDVQMRWAALAREMDFDYREMPVYFSRGSFNLPEWIGGVRQLLEKHDDNALVFVDTATAFFPGDNDNDNKQMSDYAALLREFTKLPGNPAVIVPTHPAKNSSRVTMPRGGSAFLNSVDGNFTLRRRGGDSYVRLHWAEKFRGPPFEEIRFQLDRVDGPLKGTDGVPLPSILARPISAAEAMEIEAGDTADQAVVLQALHDFPGAGYRRLAEEIGWFGEGGKQPNKNRVWRAMSRLSEAGKVSIDARKGWKIIAVEDD